jgi:hypothetical protein
VARHAVGRHRHQAPVAAIVGLRPTSKVGRLDEERARRLLGLERVSGVTVEFRA